MAESRAPVETASERRARYARWVRRGVFGFFLMVALLIVFEDWRSYLPSLPWVIWLLVLSPALLSGLWCLLKEAPDEQIEIALKILVGALVTVALVYGAMYLVSGDGRDRNMAVTIGLLPVGLWWLGLLTRRNTYGVERPDVLASSLNTAGVASALAPVEHGVFCGEIETRLGAEPLYVTAEDRGVVIGPPGTGKSAFMVTQLLDWAARRGAFVCLDIKPELHDILRPALEREGYRVLVFNPTAPVDRYNLLDDLAGTTAIAELAASLIPATGDEGQAFEEGARDIVDGIISHLRAEKRPVSLPAMREFLAAMPSERELIKVLAASTEADVREIAFALSRSAANARFMGSVFATLRANLRFLRHDEIRTAIGGSDFSLDCFLGERPVALFLQFEERHQQTTRLLLCAMISHLMNWFIAHTDRPPTLLMLDEIGNVPRVPGLVEKLNTIRSRKLPTWLYWQGLQQMQKYGTKPDEGPSSILAACDLQMAFRLNDNDTARWFSERLGTVDRTTTSFSGPAGGPVATLLDDKASFTRTTGTVEEPVMKVADLQSLPPGQAVAAYRGRVWRGWATPYFERWPAMARGGAVRPMPEAVP